MHVLKSAMAGMGLATLTLLSGGPAAAASPTNTVTSVSIDCAGDAVSGVVGIANPKKKGDQKLKVTLQGRDSGRWAELMSRRSNVGSGTSQAYSFDIAGKHRSQYRVTASIGSSSVTSDVVTDATCTPPAEVPEAPWVVLLPLSMLAAAVVVGAASRQGRGGTPA